MKVRETIVNLNINHNILRNNFKFKEELIVHFMEFI